MIFYEAWWSESHGISMGTTEELRARKRRGLLGWDAKFITCVTVDDWWYGQRELNKMLLWNGDNCPGVSQV